MTATKNNDHQTNGIKVKRRVITFLICLMISLFFWLLMTLSKEYTITVSFPVTYINLPADKVISNSLTENVDIQIKAKGFNLLFYKLRRRNQKIAFDMRDARQLNDGNIYYLLCNARVDKIVDQFNDGIHVMRIIPDTIFINFNIKITKRLPVKANLSLFFNKQFNLADSITIRPQYITVSGEKDAIDKIVYLETLPMTLRDISSSTAVNLTIKKNAGWEHVEFSNKFVKAFIRVTKYTETSIELPIEVDNLPVGYTLKTFPDKVIVKFNVAFKNYEKITPLGFRAIVDYKKIEPGSNKLKIQLTKIPLGAHNVKLATEKIEYIISK